MTQTLNVLSGFVFLDYVIPDESSRRVFQEFLGLMFIDSDELSVATALYLYGTGSNGKVSCLRV